MIGRWSEIISMLYSIFTQKYRVVEIAVYRHQLVVPPSRSPNSEHYTEYTNHCSSLSDIRISKRDTVKVTWLALQVLQFHSNGFRTTEMEDIPWNINRTHFRLDSSEDGSTKIILDKIFKRWKKYFVRINR